MVRSPLSHKQDETPLTPPREKTAREVFASGRESFGLHKITFGGHRHSEIPQNDIDYYPDDVGERELFRESNCDCDCDCTSDGVLGCLRRNKQCFFTVTILSVTTIVILLVFRSLSYDHKGKYVEDSDENTKWKSHHHHYHETDDPSFSYHDPNNKRQEIPILEDAREPDYEFPLPHVRRIRDAPSGEVSSPDGEDDEGSDASVIRGLIKERKLKYEKVYHQLNEMEKLMMKEQFSETARTVFEPFSLTSPTTVSWTDGVTEDGSYDWSGGSKEHVTGGSYKDDTTIGAVGSYGDDTTGGAVKLSTSTAFEAVNADLDDHVKEVNEEKEFEDEIYNRTTPGHSTDKAVMTHDKDHGLSYKDVDSSESEGESDRFPTGTSVFPKGKDEGHAEGFIDRAGAYDGVTRVFPTTDKVQSYYTAGSVDGFMHVTSHPAQQSKESSSGPINLNGGSSENEDKMVSPDNGESHEIGKSIPIFQPDDSFDRFTPDTDITYPESEMERQSEKSAVGISLSQAKKKKLEDRKQLLLNSRVVSEVSDIMYPTAPDETKPIESAIETSKTTQQLSMTPTAFAQYYFPYQMCFYSNPPLTSKSTQRDAAPKTFKIEAPSFFHVPHRVDDSKKSTSYHFPTQQNFLSFNINNYANHGQPPSHIPSSAGSLYALPSPHHFAPFLNGAPQPRQQPLFCTYLQPPLFQFPTITSVSETTHPKCVDCDDSAPVSKEATRLAGRELSCLESTVPCKDGSMCVPSVNWCDNKIHCRDGSDEIYCSCRERLAADRLCDGYFDCPDGEDEIGCFGCPRSTFSCDTYDEARACIPLSKRCDNVRDCPTGKDEMDCTALFPEIRGNNSHHVSHGKGFLHRNWKGDWFPVCVEINSYMWANQACLEELGPYSGEPEVSFADVSDHYKGPFIVRTEDDSLILQEHCKGHRSTYVRCPEMMCGTRVMSEEYAESRFKRLVQLKGDDFTRWWKRVKKEIMAAYKVDDVYWKVAPLEERTGKKTKREETSRVVGGKESEPRAWPWVVALYKNGDFHCGGVILDERWIMTAAHCVDHYSKNYYEVRCGMLRRFSYSPMEQIRTISDVVIHEKYNKSMMSNDLALLRMHKPLNFNRWVRPACLPSFGIESLSIPVPGTRCIATGWGATREHGSIPDQMREVEVPILSKCRHIEDLKGYEICAGLPEGGKDTCQGDSGGPLLCKDLKSSWYVAGIVSHGEGCARPGEPGAYTRVSLFMDWITANSNDFLLPPVKPVTSCPGFRCTSGSKRCISREWVCNGLTDCLNAEDEVGCHKGRPMLSRAADGNNTTYTGTLLEQKSSSPFEEDGFAKKNASAQTPVVRSLSKASEIASFVVTAADVYDDMKYKTRNETERKNDNGTPPGREETGRDSRERITGIDLATKIGAADILDKVGGTAEADVGFKKYVAESLPGKTERIGTGNEAGSETDESVEGATSRDEESSEGRAESGEMEGENAVDFIRTYNPPNVSVPDVFHCRDIIQAVMESHHCDGVVDCEDGTDESLCTCRDHLLKTNPELICNGITDCADLTDELKCHSCSKKEFNCMVSRQCLPKSKRCDEVRDCAHGEDEADCYALSKNGKVKTDGSGRPLLRLKGKLMVKKGDVWSPYCQDDDAMKPAVRTCSNLGSSGYDKYENGSDSTQHCRTLNVDCSKRLTSDLGYYAWYNNSYLWPWHAFVYSDGRKICSAALLEVNWLIADSHCMENLSLTKNHVVAKLGGRKGDADAVVEYGTQFIRVDGVKRIQNSDIILIHLGKAAVTTWQVRPISTPFWFDVTSNREVCVALADETTFLRSLPGREGSYRSFNRMNDSDGCWSHHRVTSKTGVIACQSRIGWYPASVFHENGNFCGFDVYLYENILERLRDIQSAMDSETKTTPEVACDGIRCNEGTCIPKVNVCDGKSDCPAREDENFEACSGKHHTSECRKHELRCSNGNCVPKKLFGNGVDECGDGSDEPNPLTCYDYLKLTSPDRICDGIANCYDKSDEMPDLCNCTSSKFECTSSDGVCVPRDFVCDGTKDCPNGEDEDACVGFKRIDPLGNKKEIEIIHMSYGVWHSLCTPSITEDQADEVCRELGYGKSSEMTTRNATRVSPVLDPYTAVKLNSQTNILLRGGRPFAKIAENGYCEVVVVKCE